MDILVIAFLSPGQLCPSEQYINETLHLIHIFDIILLLSMHSKALSNKRLHLWFILSKTLSWPDVSYLRREKQL